MTGWARCRDVATWWRTGPSPACNWRSRTHGEVGLGHAETTATVDTVEAATAVKRVRPSILGRHDMRLVALGPRTGNSQASRSSSRIGLGQQARAEGRFVLCISRSTGSFRARTADYRGRHPSPGDLRDPGTCR